MSKPAVPDLFGDSDDEDGARPRNPAAPCMRTDRDRPAAPQAPLDPEVREAADKLAAFVAANGRQFEDMTRERNPGDTPFKFLWNKASKDYRYFEWRVKEVTKQQQPAAAGVAAGGGSSGPASTSGRPAVVPHNTTQQPYAQRQPPHHAPAAAGGSSGSAAGRKRSRWDDQPPSVTPAPAAAPAPAQAPPPAANAASLQAAAAAAAAVAARLAREAGGAGSGAGFAGGRGGPSAGSSSGGSRPGGSGTLSAMEEYMRRLDAAAAQKRHEDEEEEEERRRRAAQPLLKETAFDRRKVVAVYKDDGERGHHMGDYIPKEELANFMTKCGNDSLQQQVEAQSTIGADNIGHKLLQKMGWQQGKGIGAKEDGRTAPVAAGGAPAAAAAAAAATGMKQDTLGLGAQAHGTVEEGDDMFEQYRKRMMLGYKYRPNPLGNPRRAYY